MAVRYQRRIIGQVAMPMASEIRWPQLVIGSVNSIRSSTSMLPNRTSTGQRSQGVSSPARAPTLAATPKLMP